VQTQAREEASHLRNQGAHAVQNRVEVPENEPGG
jgi:hypothetical protein